MRVNGHESVYYVCKAYIFILYVFEMRRMLIMINVTMMYRSTDWMMMAARECDDDEKIFLYLRFNTSCLFQLKSCLLWFLN